MKTLTPEEFVKTLQNFAKKGKGQAIADTLNAVAAEAHRLQRKNIEERMEIRSPKWTLHSLRYWKAHPKDDVRRINAIVGSVSPYLPVQDEGGDVRPMRGKTKNIPITKTARQGGTMAGKVIRRYRMDKVVDRKDTFVLPLKSGRKGIFMRQHGQVIFLQMLAKDGVALTGNHWHTDAVQDTVNNTNIAGKAYVKAVTKNILQSHQG